MRKIHLESAGVSFIQNSVHYIRGSVSERCVQSRQQHIFATDRVSDYLASTNQDDLVAVRETHYHGLSWSFAFQQAP